ncbi:MAG TPA: flagellar basal body L-ring protein FlgH [Smithellaceae bacterium]|nr:flagellar basal body L-ring protein FlgH [Smithellaceae bacterium]
MKKHSKIFVLAGLIAAAATTGCLSSNVKAVKPETVYATPRTAAQPAPGAIWRGETDKSMIFTDKKAKYLDDIVTIVITEAAQGNNRATTDTSRNASTEASIDAFLGLENSVLSRNANMGGEIAIGGTHSNSMKGAGNTSRNTTLVARVSARVIRVLDNGNLLIEGRRQVTVNAEDQYLIISGIIRPEDITTENTIASQYIADARIVYTGQGVVNDKMRPGWMTRVVDWVWPF